MSSSFDVSQPTGRFGTSAPGGLPWAGALMAVRAIELHYAWAEANAVSAHALDRWSASEPGGRAMAHALYVAALDREEAAARELADCVAVLQLEDYATQR